MKKRLFTILSVCIGFLSFSQLSGTYNIPGTYTSVAAIVADLNSQGISGSVTINILSGYTETITAQGGLVLTATGNSTASIVFQKAGSGPMPMLIAGYTGTATPSSANQDGIFTVVGGDYITFDGIGFQDNNTTNPATMEYGLGFFKASSTNGCQNNLIQNCLVVLSYVNNATGSGPSFEGSKGIMFINANYGTAATTGTSTSPAGSNSYNTVKTNTISNTNYGVVFNGYTDASPYANADVNNIIQNNTIKNFGGAASATNAAAGVRVNNQYSININNNLLLNNDGSGANHVSALRGIYLQGGTDASATIQSNTLTLVSGGTTSQLSIIENASGGSGTVNGVIISNNILQNCGYAAGTSGTLYGIYSSASTYSFIANNNSIQSFTSSASGSVNFIYNSSSSGGYTELKNNTITNHTLTTTGSMYFLYNSNAANNNVIQNNAVSNISKTGSGGTAYGYYNFGSPGNGTATINNNLFASITLSGTAGFYGFYHGTSSTQTVAIQSNTITNITGGSSTTYGIYYSFGAVAGKIANNIVTNISALGSIYGIQHNNGSTDVSGNIVGVLSTTGTAVYGLYQSGGTTLNYYKNKVYNLSSTNTNPSVYGFYITSATVNGYNNIIGDIKAPNANAANPVVGIYVGAATAANLYYNSVYLNAISTGTQFGSTALYASTTPSLMLQNNILINKSVAVGTGSVSAYRRSSTTNGTYNTISNKNIFYADTTLTNSFVFCNGTNAYKNLAAYKTYMGGADMGSYFESPTFLSLVSSSAQFIHLDPTVITSAESNAIAILSVVDDIDGDIRQGQPGYVGTGTSPDIGADEFNGIPTAGPNDVGVTAFVAPITTGCYSASENVIVSIKNFGTAVQNSIPVEVRMSGANTATINGTFTGTLNPGASANYTVGTVNMTASGSYIFKGYTGLVGDGDHTNDTSLIVRNVASTFTLPIVVPFTGFTGANLSTVFPGWYEAFGTPVPTGTTSAWTSQTGVGTATNVTARVNLYSNTHREWIIGPKFVPTANTVLSFDAAVTDWGSTSAPDAMGSDDAVYVMISTDCGLTYTPIYTISAANSLPPTLTNFVLSLSSYSNSPIIIGFYATDGVVSDINDYDFHLDNINLYNMVSIDLGAVSISNPSPAAGCYGTESVNAVIKNYGANTVSSTTVTAILSGANSATISTTYTNTINSLASATVNVGNVNMNAAGTYTLMFIVNTTGDGNTANDTIIAYYNNVIYSYPYLETFDGVSPIPGLPVGWKSDMGSTSYDFTVRTTGTSIQHGGGATQGITADLYSGNTSSWFETARIGVLPSADVELSFIYRFVNYSGYANPGGTATSITNNDSLNVYVTTNCNNTYTLIGTINGSNHTATTLFSKKTICLGSAYAGQNVKLRFTGTWSTGDYWIDVDSINIYQPTVNVTSSSTVICAGQTVTLTASGANSYTWTPAGANSNSLVATPMTPFTQTLTSQFPSGCMDVRSVSVAVNSLPTLTVSASAGTICVNFGSANLTGLPAGGTWSNGSSTFTSSTVGTYSLVYTYTDVNSCSNSDTVSVYVDACTGINNLLSTTGVKIYPNPNNGNFVIQTDNDITKDIEMLDVLGRTIYKGSSNEQIININVSNLSPGTYYLRLQHNGQIQVHKIIIQ